MKRAPVLEPPCRLIRFESTDGVTLAGLLYEPPAKSKRAVLFLHGTGGSSIFDSGRTNLLAAEFIRRGFAFFPFNNRGAHLSRRLKRRVKGKVGSVQGGAAFEIIRDCVADIDGSIAVLRTRGYTEIHAIGHSTGANKLAIYDTKKPRHQIRRLVFLAGGDDTGGIYLRLGERRFRATLAKGREKVRNGDGESMVPPSVSEMPMSWRSFVDMANPDGDYNVFPFFEALNGIRLGRNPLFHHLAAVRRPSLYVYGERDEYCYGDVPGCVAAIEGALPARRDVQTAILSGADHGFAGFEAELAGIISGWLLPSPRRRGSS